MGYTKLCDEPEQTTTSHNESQQPTASHNEPHRTTTSNNKPQQATANNKEPQPPTTSHNTTQRPTTNQKHPQQAIAIHNDSQKAIASHNEPQRPTLRHKMNKTHKKLHSLVNALSPLKPLAAGILVKTVLMLVPQVRSARLDLLTPGTHTMSRNYSVCWKHLEAFLCA